MPATTVVQTRLSPSLVKALDARASEAGITRAELLRMLLEAARNRFLLKSMSVLQKTLLILGPTTLADPSRASSAVAEHARVLAALQSRDGASAEAAMRAHVDAALSARIRGMRDRDLMLEDDV